jgi:hypothetical protein
MMTFTSAISPTSSETIAPRTEYVTTTVWDSAGTEVSVVDVVADEHPMKTSVEQSEKRIRFMPSLY